MDRPPVDRLRRSVLRVCAAEDPTDLCGTAFGIAEHWALTCAHVVEARAANSLRLFGAQGGVAVVEAVIHPDHQNCDLALLRTDQPLLELLACSTSSTFMELPISRGYSSEDIGWGGHELRFTPRGLTNINYSGPVDSFWITDAFDLAGDMAAPGYSGSPLLDTQTAAVLGVVSSGNRARGRTWAIPLSAAAAWPPLQEALNWNDQHLPRFGRLVNFAGATEICRAQVATAISLLRRSRKFVDAWDVTRTGMADIVPAFRAAKQPILAIVGSANVGKTWLLCHLASEPDLAPDLLFLAAGLDRRQPPLLDQFVKEALTEAWQHSAGDAAGAVPSTAQLAKVCADAGRPLVIFLDGVNEALDVPGFRRDWLPDAVGLCAEHRLKLIVTSRTEEWPTLARAVPEPHSSLFATKSSPSKPGLDLQRDRAPEGRYIHLGDFNKDEAAAARQSYGVAMRTDDELGRQPLLFRVARDLGIEAVAPSVGRYKLLQSFIDRQLDEVLSRVSGASIRSLRAGLQHLAASLTPGGSGGIGLIETAEHVGGNDVITAALDVGLLVATGEERVRFAYDQIADVLRPASHDPVQVVRRIAAEKKIEPGPFQEACTAILRLEAEGDEERFRSAFDALVRTLDECGTEADSIEVGQRDEDQYRTRVASGEANARVRKWFDILLPLIEGAIGVAQALPRARAAAIERLYRNVLRYRAFAGAYEHLLSFEMLGHWLAEAPLPAPLRARLVLEATPWDWAFPWRLRDWDNVSNRPNFERAADAPQSGRAGAVLNRLLREDPTGVRPILVAALQDTTKIQYGRRDGDRGEATIASLCAGLLFHRRADDPEGLYDALLDASVEDGSQAHFLWLLQELARLDPFMMASKAIGQLEQMRCSPSAGKVLEAAAAQLDTGLRTKAVAALERFLAADKLPDAGIAAKTIRCLNSGHLASWDWLIRHIDNAAYDVREADLSPIPAERLEAVLELARREPMLGLQLMQDHDGPAEDQQAMATLATELFAEREEPRILGMLAESKMNLLGKDERYAPWTAFIMTIASSGNEARRQLIYSAFGWSGSPMAAQVRKAITESEVSYSEAELIIDKMCSDRPEYWPKDWFELWTAMRRGNPPDADFLLHSRLCGEWPEIREIALAVLHYWCELPEDKHSITSRAAAEAARRQAPPETIFSLSFIDKF